MSTSQNKSSALKLALKFGAGIAALAAIGLSWSYIFAALQGRAGFASAQEMWWAATSGPDRVQGYLWLSALLPAAATGLGAVMLWYRPRQPYGDARFATAREIAAAGFRTNTGVFLGKAFRRFVIAPYPGNLLICAPPGGGKTTSISIPSALSWPGSMIVTDVKLEIFEKTAGYRAASGNDVYVFAPLSLASHSWNPFAKLEAGPRLLPDVSRIASFLIPDANPGEIWAPEARALFIGIALHLFTSSGKATIGDVYQFCRDSEATWDKCKRLVDDGVVVDEEARRLLGDYASKPPKEASGVKSTLTGGLNLWQNPLVRAATSKSDFDFADLRRRRITIYIGVTPPDLVEVGRLLALFYQQLIAALCSALPGRDEPYWVLMNQDEFAAAGKMELLKQGLAFLRGYNVVSMMFIQSPAQLEEIYGPHGRRAIFDTCKFRVFFQPNDHTTAKEISAELGNYTMSVRSRSRSKTGVSTTTSSIKRELMAPDETMRLGIGNAIVFSEGQRPFLVTKVPFFSQVAMQTRASIRPPLVPMLDVSGTVADLFTDTDDEATLLAAQVELAEALATDAHRLGLGEEVVEGLGVEIEVLLAEIRMLETK